MTKLYEADFYTWANTQAEAARKRSANELDWDNIAEELETLGRSELRELRSRYVVLLTHLLKWIHQPERRSRSWSNTIDIQRDAIAQHLSENPGLTAREEDEFLIAYREARRQASTETDLDVGVFPVEPPFDVAQARDGDWLPE